MGNTLEMERVTLEDLWDKIGAVIAAIITALGGFYMYDRKTTSDRLSTVEKDIVKSKLDIKVIETKYDALKEDTEEIKQSQATIIKLLTNRRK